MNKYPELSEAIGWNCIQRRNIGFIEAYKAGAEILYTCDDDNSPLDNWGKDVLVNKEEVVSCFYQSNCLVFDPLWLEDFWHRGFPIQLSGDRKNVQRKSNGVREVLVQADLWNGDPDIDALTRIVLHPYLTKARPYPFCADKISPFNSQNTFLSRKLFPTYFLFPGIGRMDDIWASYITQHYFSNSVIYGPPSVYQQRNEHNLVKDLEDEMIGYKYTYELIKDLKHWQRFIPKKSLKAYELYKKEFK
jgi:hypothetical protein